MPADKINLSPAVGRAEVAGDHHIAQFSQVEICAFLAALAGTQVARAFVRRQDLEGDPVEETDGGVGEPVGEHASPNKQPAD